MASTNWAQAANLLVPGLPRARKVLSPTRRTQFGDLTQRGFPEQPSPPPPPQFTTRPWPGRDDPGLPVPPGVPTPTLPPKPFMPIVQPGGPGVIRQPWMPTTPPPSNTRLPVPGSSPQSGVTGFRPAAAAITGQGPVSTTASVPVSTSAPNPFWRPRNGYGGRDIGNSNDPKDWYDTPIGRYDEDGKEMIQGEWERFLTTEGFGGFDRRSQWARSMMGRMLNGYEAAVQSNPELHVREYLNTLRGYLQKAWAGLTNEDRGINVPSQSKVVMWS